VKAGQRENIHLFSFLISFWFGWFSPQVMPDIRDEAGALKEMPRGYLEYLRRVEPYLRNQSEDCLYLNIFTPVGPIPGKIL